MHAEPERVAEAVHEVFSAGRLLGCVFGDVVLREQAERQELLVHVELGCPLPIPRSDARPEAGSRRPQHAQDSVIDCALPRGEPAVHRVGAGEVSAVIRVARTDVNQHEVARAALGIVVDVVEHAGIFAGCHDRLVAHARSSAGELPE